MQLIIRYIASGWGWGPLECAAPTAISFSCINEMYTMIPPSYFDRSSKDYDIEPCHGMLQLYTDACTFAVHFWACAGAHLLPSMGASRLQPCCREDCSAKSLHDRIIRFARTATGWLPVHTTRVHVVLFWLIKSHCTCHALQQKQIREI
jgi:hypothetical protein